MSEDSTTQCLLFPESFRTPVGAQFDQREGSPDGGALLRKGCQSTLWIDGWTGLGPAGLRDERQAVQVDHSLREWLGQRMFSIACGYFPSSRPGARRSNRLTSRRNQKLNNNIRRQQTVMVQLSL